MEVQWHTHTHTFLVSFTVLSLSSQNQFAVMFCDAVELVGNNDAKISRAYYTVGTLELCRALSTQPHAQQSSLHKKKIATHAGINLQGHKLY